MTNLVVSKGLIITRHNNLCLYSLALSTYYLSHLCILSNMKFGLVTYCVFIKYISEVLYFDYSSRIIFYLI